MTQAAFARQCKMSVHTCTWWRHRLRAAGVPAPPASLRAPRFTEVVVEAPRRGDAIVEIALRNGRVLRMPLGSVDVAALRVLLGVLDEPC